MIERFCSANPFRICSSMHRFKSLTSEEKKNKTKKQTNKQKQRVYFTKSFEKFCSANPFKIAFPYI